MSATSIINVDWPLSNSAIVEKDRKAVHDYVLKVLGWKRDTIAPYDLGHSG